MNKIKLKICGMRETANIESVVATEPDYMGFIFYKQSPRFVGEKLSLPTQFPLQIKKVGVFVNANFEDIQRQADYFHLDLLQLHGDESVQQCKELRGSGHKVIKAFSVDDDFDFKRTINFKETVDYFLFDAKGKNYGGNAQAFEWTMLNKYDQEIPFFLSGGISSSNISQIKQLRGMNIHAIDVNSGVEREPGFKDVHKIKEVIKELKMLEI